MKLSAVRSICWIYAFGFDYIIKRLFRLFRPFFILYPLFLNKHLEYVTADSPDYWHSQADSKFSSTLPHQYNTSGRPFWPAHPLCHQSNFSQPDTGLFSFQGPAAVWHTAPSRNQPQPAPVALRCDNPGLCYCQNHYLPAACTQFHAPEEGSRSWSFCMYLKAFCHLNPAQWNHLQPALS